MNRYSLTELKSLVNSLCAQFDLVRVVDPAAAHEVDVSRSDEAGLCYLPDHCFSMWQTRMHSCLNCVSQRAIRDGERQCKFEFIDEEIYYIIASPLAVDEHVLALELICRVGAEALLQSYRGDELLERIAGYNEQFRLDECTGLYNRRFLELRLKEQLAQNRAAGKPITLALVDVDRFGQINEQYGHAMGDKLLITLGQVLTGCISQRRGDFVVRLGGDEFGLVFDDIPQELLEQRVHKFMGHVNTLRVDGLPDLRLTLSVGCYRSTAQDTVESMLSEADRRLYRAKELGRNRAVFNDDDVEE